MDKPTRFFVHINLIDRRLTEIEKSDLDTKLTKQDLFKSLNVMFTFTFSTSLIEAQNIMKGAFFSNPKVDRLKIEDKLKIVYI